VLIAGVGVDRAALAATCQTTDVVPEFSWHAMGDTTPDVAWDCTGDGQPDGPGDAGQPGDDYVIRDDHTVVVLGDIVQVGTAGTGIFVTGDIDGNGSPGALVADVLRMPQPERLRLLLGSDGLICLGRCELRGAYREVGVQSPGLRAEPDPASFFEARELSFCPGEGSTVEPDCNATLAAPGDPHTVRIHFTDPEAPPPLVGRAVARIHPDDVLCRFDPNPADTTAFPDPNSCYEVVARSVETAPWIDVDVRRGSQDAVGFSMAHRQIVQSVLSGGVEAGSLEACVDGSTASALAALDREDSVRGRFVYFRQGPEACGDGDANPCRHEVLGYKITRVDLNDPGCAFGHRVTIGDVRGFRETHAIGEDVWLGYSLLGPFYVMSAVEIGSSTPQGGDSAVELRGPTFVDGVLFTEPRRIRIRDTAVVERFSRFWVRDPGGILVSNASTTLIVESDGADIGPGAVTGVRAESNCGALVNEPCGPFARGINVNANATRVHDLFLWPTRNDTFQISNGEVLGNQIERVYAGPIIDGSSGINFIEAATSVPGLGSLSRVRDVFCDGCTDAVTMTGWIDQVEGLAIWNGGGGVDPRAPTNDMLVVGSRNGVDVGGNIDGFVVRDSNIGGAVLSLVDKRWNPKHPGEGLYVRNGFVQRVNFGGQLIDYDDIPLLTVTPGTIENVGFFDVQGSLRDHRLFQFEGDPFEVARRITIGFTEGFNAALGGEPNVLYGLFAFNGVDDFTKLTLDGLLLTGLRNNVSSIEFPADQDFADVTWLNGPCLFDNDVDTLPGKAALLPPTTVFGDPGFVDPESYRFDVEPGSLADRTGCGISSTRAPGILRKRWIHAVANIEPEFVPEPSRSSMLGWSLVAAALLARRPRRLAASARS
jgi:hypothetical protein